MLTRKLSKEQAVPLLKSALVQAYWNELDLEIQGGQDPENMQHWSHEISVALQARDYVALKAFMHEYLHLWEPSYDELFEFMLSVFVSDGEGGRVCQSGSF